MLGYADYGEDIVTAYARSVYAAPGSVPASRQGSATHRKAKVEAVSAYLESPHGRSAGHVVDEQPATTRVYPSARSGRRAACTGGMLIRQADCFLRQLCRGIGA